MVPFRGVDPTALRTFPFFVVHGSSFLLAALEFIFFCELGDGSKLTEVGIKCSRVPH